MAFGDEVFPQKFGEYVLLERIAIGGMAEIFRAKAPTETQKEICIKRILPHYSEDDAFVKMFIDEATIAAKLDQKNIVQIYDFDIVDDSYYIAMELVYGRDLKQTLETGAKRGVRLTPEQVAYISAELSKALQYAHTRAVDGKPLNIIHRDVSPHNVLLGFNSDIKLTDFGIAKAASRLTTTRAGTVKGKCAYMSPEQARGRTLDHRSDLFSVGILMHEMLTGRRLFSGESDFDILTKVLKEPIRPPSEFNPDVPKAIEGFCLKALERERNRRYRSCEELQLDLERWMQSNGWSRDNIGLDVFLPSLFGVSDVPLSQSQQARPLPSGESASISAQRPTLDSVPGPALPSNGKPITDMATQQFDREALMSGSQLVLERENLQPKLTIPMHPVTGPSRAGPNEPTGPQTVQPVPDLAPRMIIPAPSSAAASASHDDKTAVMNIADYEAKMARDQAAKSAQAPQAHHAPTRAPDPPPKKKGSFKFIAIFGILLLLGAMTCVLAGGGAYVYTQTDLLAGAMPDEKDDDNGKTGKDKGTDDDDGELTDSTKGGDDDGDKGSDDESNDDESNDDDSNNDESNDGGEDDDNAGNDDGDDTSGDDDNEGEGPPIKVISEPAGAKVFFAGDRRPGVTPMDITGFATGSKIKLRIRLDGYADALVEHEVTEEDNTIEVKLETKAGVTNVGANTANEPPKEVTPQKPKRELTPAEIEAAKKRREEQIEAAKKRREEQKKKAQATKGEGTVTINAYPFAEVSVDGRKVGRTPIRGYKLSTGRHTIVLTNPDLKKTQRKRVTIKKDEAVTVFHNFK